MISSPAGRATAESLRGVSDGILTYLYDVRRHAEASCASGCGPGTAAQVAAEFLEIETKLKALAVATDSDLKKMKQALIGQRTAIREVLFLTDDLKKKDATTVKLSDGTETTWTLLREFNEKDHVRTLTNEFASDPNLSSKLSLEGEIARVPLLAKVRKTLQQDKAFQEYVQTHVRYKKLLGGLYEGSLRVAQAERALYLKTYQKFKGKEGANPCKDFIF